MRHAEIAGAELAQGGIHIGEHGVDHALGELGPGLALPLQPVEQQERMQRDELEPSVQRVGHAGRRSEEHTSELQSLMRISYAVFCLKKNTSNKTMKQNKHLTDEHSTTS